MYFPCSLASQLSKTKGNVLIISTDPAHNLSDAFNQKFTKEPTKVNGYDNLFAMEIDPHLDVSGVDVSFLGQAAQSQVGTANSIFQDIAGSIPGIDEAVSFAELMKLVQEMNYDTIVFDTAPTGHTLRLLAFPQLLDKALTKLLSVKSKLSGVLSQVQAMIPGLEADEDVVFKKLESTKIIIDKVNEQFQNPDLTQFVCVAIPEFLSLYETERLVQELAKFEIDTHNVVVNQLLFPSASSTCKMCASRMKIQQKYLEQIYDLYEDFNIVKMPLLESEVRGSDAIKAFSEYLRVPYVGHDGESMKTC
eukprot:TRINITY_DN8169_c0_g1_i2.p1 TRINITY_DN8169_c0_g1~~TRINITY_DN8169_c0_g1_i2.p1  ORF type:complete len:359 (+),score=88.55 TRINITY_DN8169_c0_g1_i2:161-1078(+)